MARVDVGCIRRSTWTCRRWRTRPVLDGTAAYERRHGWKGNLENVVDGGQGCGALGASGLEMSIEKGGYYHGAG